MSDELLQDLDWLIMSYGDKEEVSYEIKLFVDKYHKELLSYDSWEEIHNQIETTISFFNSNHTRSIASCWKEEEWLYLLLTAFMVPYRAEF